MEEVGEWRGSLKTCPQVALRKPSSESKNDCDIQNYDSEECELQDHMYMLYLFHAKTIPSAGVICQTPNAKRRMHCLLAVSFTLVCLWLAFIC